MGTLTRSTSYADVALPVPVDKLFTYTIPDALAGRVAPGCRVLVPFGRRRMTGYVVSLRGQRPGRVKLKSIGDLVDEEPLLTPRLLELARWIASYYVHSLGEVLRTMLPAGLRGRGRFPSGDETAGKFPPEIERPILSAEQEVAFTAVTSSLGREPPARFLLHGITGSGKTEVYLRCIDTVLAAGGSALVLIPEIALIPQTTARFRRRFGRDVAVLHSRLTGAQRLSIWEGAASGAIRIVIGARSAIFVPLQRLGIIVVDEEQDTSYKQEEKPHYHAVTVAEERAAREGAVLLLGSATPSLESYERSRRGEITRLELGSRPFEGRMPPVEIIDMRGREGIVSDELLDGLEACIGRGEQAIVLINRRGHANFVQCTSCGWIDRCPNCSISLTYHSRGHRLVCHYCGYEKGPMEACPQCRAYKLVHRGTGTQRVEMELQNLLPGARVVRMDLDTTAGKRGHLAVLEIFSRGDANVLLGTQMVAKGHHYPNVTLVGVILADSGLSFPDFRAAERTFQLLYQAAGRTGRGGKGGHVIVQTYMPGHYLFGHLFAYDFNGFAAQELGLRNELGYPPVGRLILFTVTSGAAASAIKGGDEVHRTLEKLFASDTVGILGPVPALVERVRGRYRVQVLVRGVVDARLRRKIIQTARQAVSGLARTDIQWDVDPLTLV
ncbi:MAG TPA: primosomal protein N' [Patescibacteria group bacterium]|nr:primosomal protein N' [Patescibacteria group bacterium]